MKILLATDGSPKSKYAAHFLRQLKIQEKLKLVLLTVSLQPERSIAGNVQNPEWKEQERAFVTKHHAELEELFAGQCDDYLSKLHQTGDVAQAILDVSKRIEPDLIVLGAVGHSMIGRMLLGSVSDSVATNARCSVLVVRPRDADATTAESPKKLTVAYDGSNASREAISEMLRVNWGADTEIDIVTVAPRYDYLMGDGMTAAVLTNEEEVFERMRGVGREMSEQVSATLPNTHSQVVSGQHVGDTIVSFAEKNHSDLIILGDTGHSLLHDLLLGSTTKYVLRHAPCSVWISRHHRAIA